MAITITKGYTFGATELVTSTKLHSLVDSATVSGAVASDGTTGGTGSAGSGKQYVAMTIGNKTYKVLHDGEVT